MVKQIKSFTVDEEVYNRIITMIKKYKAKTSLSLFVNYELQRLLTYLEDIEKGLKDMGVSVPMSFVIDDFIKMNENPKRLSSVPDSDDDPVSELEFQVTLLEEKYKADKEGIPRDFYQWLKGGNFILSNDKKYLVDKKDGENSLLIGTRIH